MKKRKNEKKNKEKTRKMHHEIKADATSASPADEPWTWGDLYAPQKRISLLPVESIKKSSR